MTKPSDEEIRRMQAEKRRAERRALFEELQVQTDNILSAVDARRLIVVDDEVRSIDRYITAFDTQPNAIRNLGEDDLDPQEDRTLWRQSAATTWGKLLPQEQDELLRAASRILDEANPDRMPGALEAVSRIFREGQLLIVSPQEWEDQQDELIAAEPPPVVLFDHQLGSYEKTGLDLLNHYRKLREGSEPPAGVLSSEVNEHGELTTMTEEQRKQIPPESLMLISKDHLNKGDYRRAVELFRLTANLPHLQRAKERVLNGFLTDATTAIADVRTMSPRVLEDLVYRSSHVEGAWEGETLARITRLYLIRATRDREVVDDLRDLVQRARRLSRRVAPADDVKDSASVAAELQEVEHYVPAAWVNGLQLPLANGDIFEIRVGGQRPLGGEGPVEEPRTHQMVLVAQPCDLIVRNGGQREMADGRLLPIVARAKARQTLLEQPLIGSTPAELPDSALVELKKGFNVDLALLDLCWFNIEGRAEIEDVSVTSTERMLTDGLDVRRAQLTAIAAGALEIIAAVPEDDLPLRQYAVGAQQSGELTLDYDPEHPRRWAYRVKRIGRLDPRQAESLLVRHTAAEARAAFDHDLGTFD